MTGPTGMFGRGSAVMKRRVWLRVLLMWLGFWHGRAVAQEPVWHKPASPTVPVTLTGSELIPCPAASGMAPTSEASLGRPVPFGARLRHRL